MNGYRSLAGNRAVTVVLALAAFLLAWEGGVVLFDVQPFLLPAPSAVLVEIWANVPWYLDQAASTLLETALGFGLAVVLGLLMAVSIVYSRVIEQVLYTLLVAMNSVPKVAIAPLFVVWLGTDLEPKVAISFLIAVFPIVIDGVLGLRSVDPDMIDLAKSLKGNRLQVLRKIRLPNAMPSIFAGMKVGISFAFIGAIVGEFVASNSGLGFVIMTSQATFDTTRMFAAILLLSLMGTALFYIVEVLERVLIPWHVSRRREGHAQA